MVNEDLKPAFSPLADLSMPITVTGIVIRLVTPWRVKSPVTSRVWGSFWATDVLVKESAGYFSTSKKSAERRCLLRASLSVLIDADLTEKATLSFAAL